MYLVFDGVSQEGYIWLYDSDRQHIFSERFHISGNESTLTISVIHNFLNKHWIFYWEIENIIVIVGPGSFTGIRTISLVVNTLAYIHKNIYLTPINIFDLYDSYPIVIPSSKRDLFVKWKKWAIIEVLQNTDFEAQSLWKDIYGDIDTSRFVSEYICHSARDYESFLCDCKLQELKKVAPLYMKKPNIS